MTTGIGRYNEAREAVSACGWVAAAPQDPARPGEGAPCVTTRLSLPWSTGLLTVTRVRGTTSSSGTPRWCGRSACGTGWIATTTQRECLRVLRASRRHEHAELPDDQLSPDPDAAMIEKEILAAERDAAVWAAFAELPRGCRELLAMLLSDHPHSYEDISATLGMRVGSIGPMRARCLDRLRQSPHIAAIADGARDKQARGERGD